MMSSKQILQILWAHLGRHLGSLKSSKQTGQDNSSNSESLNREDDMSKISSLELIDNTEHETQNKKCHWALPSFLYKILAYFITFIGISFFYFIG